MIYMRFTLWCMLFTGVIVHMLCSTSLYIAITTMIKRTKDSKNQIFTAACSKSILNFNATDVEVVSSFTIGEFEWDNTLVHILMSSFNWFMGVGQLIGGVLCQKYGGKLMFGYSNLILGILSCLIPLSVEIDVKLTILIRIIQGLVGGAAIGNAANILISKWVPPHERGKFVGVMAGLYSGIAVSYFLNGWILYWFGWRTVFYVTGIITFIWCFIWNYVVYDSPQEHPYISPAERTYIEKQIGTSVSKTKLPIPWRAIICSGPIIVNTLCQIASMWTIFTIVLYVPTYFTEVHGYPSYKVGAFSSLPHILETIFGLGLAWFTDYLLRKKKISTTNVRKLAVFFNSTLGGILFMSLAFGGCNAGLIITLITAAVMVNGAILSGIGPNVIDLSPNFCAVIHGIQGFIASSAGYLSPLLVAYLRNTDKPIIVQWYYIFLITGILNIVPGIFFFIFSDSNVQPWNYAIPEKESSDEKLLKNSENGRKLTH